MKKIIIFMLLIMPICANAAEPSTSCPARYISINEDVMTIADSTCPSGYVSAGTAASCLVSSPAGSCIMYAPTGTTYTDDSGSYEFTCACPLE